MHLQNLTHVLTSVVLFCAQFIQLDQVTASSLEQTYTSWQLDASFGTNGIVEFDGDSTPPSYNFLNYRTFPKSDGGIHVLACHLRLQGKTPVDSCSVFAYSTLGQLVTIAPYFGRSGFVDVHRYDVQSNNRLIFTAYLEAQRLNPDLTPDSTITSTGLTTLFASGFYSNNALGELRPIAQTDDRILLTNHLGNGDLKLARLLADGSLDHSFGITRVISNIADIKGIDTINSHLVLLSPHDTGPSTLCTAREYDPTGLHVTTIFDPANASNVDLCSSENFVRHPDGGYAWIVPASSYAIYRSKSTGGIDEAFGNRGSVQITPPSPSGLVFAGGPNPLTVLPSGEIVTALTLRTSGPITNSTQYFRMLTGFNPDGSPYSGLGPDGKMILSINACCSISELFILPNGKLLLTGMTYNRFMLIRMKPLSIQNVTYLPIVLNQTG